MDSKDCSQDDEASQSGARSFASMLDRINRTDASSTSSKSTSDLNLNKLFSSKKSDVSGCSSGDGFRVPLPPKSTPKDPRGTPAGFEKFIQAHLTTSSDSSKSPFIASPFPDGVSVRSKGSGAGGGRNTCKDTPRSKYDITPSVSNITTPSTKIQKQKPLVLIALAEGRGKAKGEIGMAAMDLRHPEMSITQFSDTPAYSRLRVKLHVFTPVEILLPETAMEKGGSMSALLELLRQEFPRTQVTSVHRKYFNSQDGIECIQRIMEPECSKLEKNMDLKYYCLSSVAALVKYIEFVQHTMFAENSVKIIYTGVENTCMIDPETVKHLELIVSEKNATSSLGSLCSVMDHTFTNSGSKSLRSNILQPPSHEEVTNNRLDAVQELLSNDQRFRSLRSVMSRMVDVDSLLNLCVHQNSQETVKSSEYKLNRVIQLKHSAELALNLKLLLADFETPVVVNIREKLLDEDRLKEVMGVIVSKINEDTKYQKGTLNIKTQQCFSIKSGVDGLIDVLRQTYSELIEDTHALVERVSEECGIRFHAKYSAERGFFMQTGDSGAMDSKKMPAECILVQQMGRQINCTTRNLIKFNDRINQVVGEILVFSGKIVVSVLADIRTRLACLYNLTEAIGQMDLLLSLAHFASITDSVRPVFGTYMAIRKGRHPLLEKLQQNTVVANDIYAADDCCFNVITGPNMSGKSTFLKQIALMQILAQAGSFVPAEYASFRVCDQIFSRMGHNDDLQHNASSFTVEMRDMCYILKHVTAKSLVVIDELCRCTSVDEGFAICYAMCESLIDTKAYVFIATHFLELMHLDAAYPSVENYHFGMTGMKTGEGDTVQLVFDHSLKKGPFPGDTYGFELAEQAQFPQEVMEKAKKICDQLTSQTRGDEARCKEAAKTRAIFRLCHKLKRTLAYQDEPAEQLNQYLTRLRNQFKKDMQAAESV